MYCLEGNKSLSPTLQRRTQGTRIKHKAKLVRLSTDAFFICNRALFICNLISHLLGVTHYVIALTSGLIIRRPLEDTLLPAFLHKTIGFLHKVHVHFKRHEGAYMYILSRYISRVENEKGLCAYIIYMHIAPFHSQPSI